jgi:hypothetical protein
MIAGLQACLLLIYLIVGALNEILSDAFVGVVCDCSPGSGGV